MPVLTLIAPEIHCDGCAASIRRSLGRMAGVEVLGVDVPGKSVRVAYDAGLTSQEAIVARMHQAGFPPTVVEHSQE